MVARNIDEQASLYETASKVLQSLGEDVTLADVLVARRNERAGRATADLPGLPKGVAAWWVHDDTLMTEPPKVLDGHAYPHKFAVTYVGPGFGSVTLSFSWAGARLVCAGVNFAATELHSEVKASDLQEFPLMTFFEDAITRVSIPADHWALRDGLVSFDALPPFPAPRGRSGDVVASVNRRRSKVNDENLRRVAAIVIEHPKAHYERADAAASREAYAAICEEFNLGSIRTAQLWVKRAKDRGLLK